MMIVNKAAVAVVGAVLTVTGFVGAAFALKDRAQNNPNNTEPVTTTYARPTKQTAPEQQSGDKKYKFRDDMEVILFMGTDERKKIDDKDDEYVHYTQADALYVFAIDHKNKTYQILQVNRDTMCDVKQILGIGEDDIASMQVCLAHSYGKTEQARCLNVCDSVSGLICDVPIDHYVSLSMLGIADFNDIVGGVTITMPGGLEDAYPDFKEGISYTFKGKKAEDFLRARYLLKDDYNSSRMKRQELYMNAWKGQAIAKMQSDSEFPMKMVLALSEYMTSDMTANQLADLAKVLKDYKQLDSLTTTGEYLEEGDGRLFREFHVNEEDLHKKVIELFYEEVPA